MSEAATGAEVATIPSTIPASSDLFNIDTYPSNIAIGTEVHTFCLNWRADIADTAQFAGVDCKQVVDRLAQAFQVGKQVFGSSTDSVTCSLCIRTRLSQAAGRLAVRGRSHSQAAHGGKGSYSVDDT